MTTFARGILVAMVLFVGGSSAIGADSSAADNGAAFNGMARVLQSPRCMNCHTATGFPRQGDDRHPHFLNVSRGVDGHGTVGLHCSACHQDANQRQSGVPGAPDWHLAPLRMAWEGLTVGELCRALLDPERGGMKQQDFVPHLNSALVRWAWSPGNDSRGNARTLPPISHDDFIALTQKWIAGGTQCPT